MVRRARGCLLLIFSACACAFAQAQTAFDPAVQALSVFIDHEVSDKKLPSLSVALVNDQKVVWTHHFGDGALRLAAPAGPVSQLFTAIAVMQLVERGDLDLDEPVSKYLPEFHPRNPFPRRVTLRQLLSHRSGLVREPPAGSLYDSSSPTLAATVESLNASELLYAPQTHLKYSDAGIAVAALLTEKIGGCAFADCIQHNILARIGMDSSSFAPGLVSKGAMWTYDERALPAPLFPLGIAPAASLRTTVADLATFLSMLFAGGRGSNGAVLKSETLEQMWTPQFEPRTATSGVGLGFRVGRIGNHRVVGQGGSVYGFTTTLSALPDDKLGIVVVCNLDNAAAVTSHIANVGLKMMLSAKDHRPVVAAAVTSPIPRSQLESLQGRYPQGSGAPVDLEARAGDLYRYIECGGFDCRLRELNGNFIADDRLAFGWEFPFPLPPRVPFAKPVAPPDDWRNLIGEYGPDYNTLFIHERNGRLTALTDWFEFGPLMQLAPDVFRFPDSGRYDRETLTFTRDANGRATQVSLSGIVLPRRNIEPAAGATFRIVPVRPAAELRDEAMRANPPAESSDLLKPDLLELVKLDPSIHLDIRYASTNNFMSTTFYPEARAFLQRPAAEALVRASAELKQLGYGLLIHDGYRPWYVTKMFWDATPADKHIFVADPSEGSKHNRGCAVDLNLYDLKTGAPIEMTGGYDEMSDRSFPDYPGGTSLQRWHRHLLRNSIEKQGFTVNEAEWWHFDFYDWKRYPILNIDFSRL